MKGSTKATAEFCCQALLLSMEASIVKALLSVRAGHWSLKELQSWPPFLTALMSVSAFWPPSILEAGLTTYNSKVGGLIAEGQHEDWAREASFYLKSMLNFVRKRSERVKTGERLPDWLREVVAARMRAKERQGKGGGNCKPKPQLGPWVAKHRRLMKRLSETDPEPQEIPLPDAEEVESTPQAQPLQDQKVDPGASEWARLEQVFGASRTAVAQVVDQGPIEVDSSGDEDKAGYRSITYHDHGHGVMVRADSYGAVMELGEVVVVDSEEVGAIGKEAVAKPASKDKPKAKAKPKAKSKAKAGVEGEVESKAAQDKGKGKAKATAKATARANADNSLKAPGGLGCSKCRYLPKGCGACKRRLAATKPDTADVE